MRIYIKALITVLLLGVCIVSAKSKTNYTTYVNPFLGTGAHGHTYPGASVPFGMVQVSPDTRQYNWDACSGYHYSDKTIVGFSHTHLSGTGIGDYADIMLMPTTGSLQLQQGDEKIPNSGYRSHFSHEKESAAPGYYSVFLEDYKIKAELTATRRAGFHRYTFPESDQAKIIIDLTHQVKEEQARELVLRVVNSNEIEGLRRSQGWAEDHYVYFVARFSTPFNSVGIAVDDQIKPGIKEASGKNIKAFVQYSTKNNEQILIKVGISGVSMEGARKNLDAEIQGWDFDKVCRDADKKWNEELGKIQVEDDSKANMATFYTSLYHAMLNPNLFMDVDGQYRGADHKVHKGNGFENHTVFSLWDTFRAANPLFTTIQPEKTVDLIKTMLARYDERGILPIWELAGNETGCMIGNHAIPVIVDAYLKGIRNFDVKKAYEAIKKSADQDTLGLEYYKKLGYVPSDKENESVSKTLEYAYDDWCVAQMAKALDQKADFDRFSRRAMSYKNLYDDSTGFMRGKSSEGIWKSPFNPKYSKHRDDEYTEGNAWQWLWFVPQDIDGLIKLIGGKERFSVKLDSLFSTDSHIEGEQVSSDISGLIGQYAHGNEPSQHIAYLYNYAGKPWKTQQKVNEILTTLYNDGAEGLCGNEDCGQMSAWYVLSAMGFYSVTPCQDYYAIGSPLFKKVTIHLSNGKKFVIKAENEAKENIYIQSVTLNGKPYNSFKLKHNDLINGGEIVFHMGSEPEKTWAVN